MSDEPTMTVDRVDEDSFEWQIFLGKDKGTPTVYLLYADEVVLPHYNWQIVLTKYDGIEAAEADKLTPVLQEELFSTYVYVDGEERLEELMAEMIECLEGSVINCPVEMAHRYGGMIRGLPVKSAPKWDAH